MVEVNTQDSTNVVGDHKGENNDVQEQKNNYHSDLNSKVTDLLGDISGDQIEDVDLSELKVLETKTNQFVIAKEAGLKTSSTEDKPTDVPKPTLNIVVSMDKISAYLRVVVGEKGQMISYEDVIAVLTENKIVYGIDHERIKDYCNSGEYYKELKVASGVKPLKGLNARIEYYFDRDYLPMLHEDESGRVDFKNINLVQNVTKDQLLVKVTPAQPGVDGINIYGEAVPAQPGDDFKAPSGKNIYTSEDGLEVYAAVDGSIEMINNVISISDIYHVNGDVGPLTGNVHFNGSVVVSGSILEGFSVDALRDITVRGMVEGANLTAEGDILISDGFNGMGKGKIFAKGDIISRFVENGVSICGGNFQGDVILNSVVKAGNSIVLKGNKSSLVKGTCVAGEKIIAKNMGTDNSALVEAIISPNWYDMEVNGIENENLSDTEIEARIQKLKSNIHKINQAIAENKKKEEELKSLFNDEQLGKKARFMSKQLMLETIKHKNEIRELEKQIETFLEAMEYGDLKVVFTGMAYPGVKVRIRNAVRNIDTILNHQKFYYDKGDIAIGNILPGEK